MDRYLLISITKIPATRPQFLALMIPNEIPETVKRFISGWKILFWGGVVEAVLGSGERQSSVRGDPKQTGRDHQ